MSAPVLGLRANWQQFWLLVLVNAFVGAMIGLERTVVPLLAEEDFGLAGASVATSFIVSFGIVKALANPFAGQLSDRIGRKSVLIIGWLFALPVPLIIILAPSWWWIVFANVLLGVNQGLAWSTTVTMKIDLVGPQRRGLAMGMNEFAGYAAVGATALATGWIAQEYGPRPEPFFMGFAFAIAGLLLSIFVIRETRGHAIEEARMHDTETDEPKPPFWTVFARSSWRNGNLFSTSQAGLVTNLSDGMAWGLLPIYFAAAGLAVGEIGMLAAIYPVVWGVGQLVTGPASDWLGRKWLIATGMWVQAAAIAGFVALDGYTAWMISAAFVGFGTAMVYPTLLAAVADNSQTAWRASALGVYRFWRDSGYAAGALMAGVMADAFNATSAIWLVAIVTGLSGVIVAVVQREQPRAPQQVANQATGSQTSPAPEVSR